MDEKEGQIVKLDIELSLQISDKIYLHSKNYYKGIRDVLLTEAALANGIYVEGWHVDLGLSKVPQEKAWIELGDRIIDPDPHVTSYEANMYFPGLRFTQDQAKRFRKLPRAHRYLSMGLLSSKYYQAKIEAYKFAMANGLEERYRPNLKRFNLFRQLLIYGFLMLVGVPLYIFGTLLEAFEELIKSHLSKSRKG